MGTQLIAKTGEIVQTAETTSEFSARLKSEMEARRTGTDSKVQTYYTSSGKKVSVGVETIGGEQKAIIVGSPEAIEEVSPSRTSKVQQYEAPSGGKLSVGTETIEGQPYQVVVGSPEAIQEITLKRQQAESFGIYDSVSRQTRLATPIESMAVSKQLRDTQVSYLPGYEPKERSISELLSDTTIEQIYFRPTKEGPKPVLVHAKPIEPTQLYRKADEPEGIGVKGFFDVKSADFLDVTDFFRNIQKKGADIYQKTLDPQFAYRHPDQFWRTLKGTGLLVTGAGVSFAGGVVSGFTMPFRHPIETAKGFKELVVHPVKSTKEISASFITDPFGTAGEFYGFGKGIKTIKKGAPIKLEYESFGKGGLKTMGITIGYEAIGRKAIPIGTYYPKTLIGEGFVQPKTLVGTKIFKKKIGKIITEPTEMLVEGKTITPELQREFAVKGIESTYELARVKSKFFTKEALYEQGTQALTPKEAKIVFETIGTQKGKLFGSFSSMPQLKASLRRPIGDIEAKFDITSETQLAQYTQANLLALQKVSRKGVFRILPEQPFHIEKRIKGQYEKVVEFKGEGIGEGDVAPAFAFGYDLWTGKDFMKVDSTMTAMLRGELKRKTAGSIIVKEKALGVAHPGRFKDVADLYRITETLELSKKGRTPKAKAFLKTAEKLGVEYKIDEGLMFEILEKKLSEIKSPRMPSISPGLPSISPKMPSPRMPSISPGLPSISPKMPSPGLPSISPGLPSISPKMPSPGLPSISPGLPSPRMPSVKSPKISPSMMPSISPGLPSISPSISPGFPSPSISPSMVSLMPYVPPSPPIPGIMLPRKPRDYSKTKTALKKETFAYIPDFTAKALGLTFKPQSEAQLKKLLKKQFTGLEIARFGVRI